jgi:hypothetical protein
MGATGKIDRIPRYQTLRRAPRPPGHRGRFPYTGTRARTLTDGDWTARSDGDCVACVPLTPHRARLLRGLLADMLDEAAAIGDMMIREDNTDRP